MQVESLPCRFYQFIHHKVIPEWGEFLACQFNVDPFLVCLLWYVQIAGPAGVQGPRSWILSRLQRGIGRVARKTTECEYKKRQADKLLPISKRSSIREMKSYHEHDHCTDRYNKCFIASLLVSLDRQTDRQTGTWGGNMCNAFTWLTTGTSGGLLWAR
jgi:hypothetical protein